GRGFEQRDVGGWGGGGGDDRGQWFDREGDGIEGVLGGRGTCGQHDRDGFADIADLVVGDDGLLERLEGGRGVLPQRNGRDRGASIRRRGDGGDARACAGGGGIV